MEWVITAALEAHELALSVDLLLAMALPKVSETTAAKEDLALPSVAVFAFLPLPLATFFGWLAAPVCCGWRRCLVHVLQQALMLQLSWP